MVISSQRNCKPSQRSKRGVDNLTEERKEVQPIFMSASLPTELRRVLLDLLKGFKDVSAWTYIEMPELGQHLVTHKLNI